MENEGHREVLIFLHSKRTPKMTAEFNFYELKHSGRLPSPSGAALRILQLIKSDETTVVDLAHTLKTDPALTSRILTFANSAAFGSRRPIVNVTEAAQMMGMRALGNLALSLSLVGNNLKGPCKEFDYNAYWMQSLAFAVSLAAITTKQTTVAPEEAFTIGLLSEIGQLALATVWPEEFAQCLHLQQEEELLKLEFESFVIDHRALTLMLLHDWGLPTIFLDALKMSFDLNSVEVNRTTRLADQLCFARQLAKYCVADDQYRNDALAGLERVAELHDLDSEALAGFVDDIFEQWHIWGKIISINTDQKLVFDLPSPNHEELSKLPGLKIVLLNEDSALLGWLSKQLIAMGHQVVNCQDEESALTQIFEHQCQILVVDRHLKQSDGMKLCKTLRRTDIGKKLYIIMLTDSEIEDEYLEAFESGIDDYIIKPVKLKILLARIRAGQRIALLQRELEQEKEDIQRYNAELALANRRLNVMANTDELTGLSNRRYALQRLKQEWEAAVRYNRPLSVIMLDLDHFKSINDTSGHEAGDEVLMHTASLMQAGARATDVVCRFGGEEFLIIATNTDGKTALLLAERIRSSIRKLQPKDIALSKPITVSIGVAGSIGQKTNWDELIRLADQALYSAKADGRNKSRLAKV